MAIEVIIRQNGILSLFKKTLPRQVLLGNTLECGQYEKNYLIAPYDDTDGLVLYNPEAAGRGIRASWTPGEKNEVRLRLELPCHSREVDELVGVMQRISDYWKCKAGIIHADKSYSEISNLSEYKKQTARLNELVLGDLVQQVSEMNQLQEPSGFPEYILLQCALWPVAFGPDVAAKVREDTSYFDWWLHKIQCVDARYCYPDFWKLENGLIEGQYDVIAGRPHILPYRPYVASWSRDLKTGEPIQADVFRINFFSETGEGFLGDIPYDLWRYSFFGEKCQAYDACHFRMKEHTGEELLDICRRALEISNGTAEVTIGEQRWNAGKENRGESNKAKRSELTKSERLDIQNIGI